MKIWKIANDCEEDYLYKCQISNNNFEFLIIIISRPSSLVGCDYCRYILD